LSNNLYNNLDSNDKKAKNYKKKFLFLSLNYNMSIIINDLQLNMKNAIDLFSKITSILITTLMDAQKSSFLNSSYNHKPKFHKKSV
jgi:ABC-type uncharacterized transport system fused permease/ATPase subunit